jgi:nucleotide-binding universal stress UspA family protein
VSRPQPGPAEPLVIAAVDGEEGTPDVVTLACALARRLDGRILVAHVYPGAGRLSPVPARGLEPQPPRRAEEVLVRAASLASGIEDVELRAIEDRSVGPALVTLARQERAAAIVVGSTGRTGERLVHGAQALVAVAPRGSARRSHAHAALIGCAFDGSPEAAQALAVAERLAAKDRAALEVITWVDPSDPGRARRVRKEAERAIAGLSRGVAAEAVLVPDTGDEVLGERSGALELLVCGSRAHGSVHAVLLGSFSARLLGAARCPVLVVPRGLGS